MEFKEDGSLLLSFNEALPLVKRYSKTYRAKLAWCEYYGSSGFIFSERIKRMYARKRAEMEQYLPWHTLYEMYYKHKRARK